MDSFALFAADAPLPPLDSIRVLKKGNFYDFKVSDKRGALVKMGVAVPHCTVEGAYNRNMRKLDKEEGHLFLGDSERLIDVVNLIEERAQKSFIGQKIFSSTLCTKHMFNSCFKSSMVDGCLKVSVGRETTVFYDANKTRLEPVMLESLYEKMIIDVLIEPNFFWMMKDEQRGTISMGIRWDVRQIKLGSNVAVKVVLSLLEPDRVEAQQEETEKKGDGKDVPMSEQPRKALLACMSSDDTSASTKKEKVLKKVKKVKKIKTKGEKKIATREKTANCILATLSD